MSDLLSQLTSALADRYRIERELGAGGMATVYLAQDLKHDRRVALKVLKPELAAVLGAERFVVEIKTTAALQHPHILPLFDSGTADGFLYYVMPYIQGETLRTKLDRETQLGLDEAVRITREVADALDYAHRHGVIHRDIKPENILLHDGRPMVADFGIALAVSAAAGGRMTETGLSLGTPHYMSPEQATAEKELGNRSDIYSLGCVLYEMLTGSPPHVGASAQQIIMKIVTEEAAPVTKLRKSVPPNVAAATARAIEKLPADRFETAAKFAEALDNPSFTTEGIAGRPARATARRSGVSVRLFAATCALAVAATAGTTWWVVRRSASAPAAVHFAVNTQPGEPIGATLGRNLALAPDGRTLVYATRDSAGTQRLFVRPLNDLRARAIAGTEGAESPFFSPDGRSIGFTVSRRELRRIPVEGGASSLLAELDLIVGASWGPDGIVVSNNGQLVLVPSQGGTPLPFIAGDTIRGYWPVVLAAGKVVVFASNGTSDGALQVASRSAGRTVQLDLLGAVPLGVAAGNLIFLRSDGALMAAPFDAGALRALGDARVVIGQVAVNAGAGEGKATLSENGVLAYVSGTDLYRPAFVDLRGIARTLGVPPGRLNDLRYSPDGRRYAASVLSTARSDIYVFDVESGAAQRLTFDGTLNGRPEWSADGTRILYRTNRGGGSTALWWQRADGTGSAERLHAPPGTDVWEGVLPPGDSMLIYRTGSLGDADIMYRRLRGDTAEQPVAMTRFTEQAARVSPDGRWIVYQSDESGRYEIYVRPFPGPGPQSPVSVGGGSLPLWSRDGRTIFFTSGSQLVAAAVATQPTFSVGRREILFTGNFLTGAGHAQYDVSPDGASFLMLQPVVGAGEQIVVIYNWAAELRAGAKGEDRP